MSIKNNKGFTLVELLVVMVVLLTVGTIIGVILFSAFRGANKTNTIIQVRQNGSYAIAQMEKTIRGAYSLDGMSLNNIDFIDCPLQAVVSTGTPTPTPTPVQYTSIKFTSFDKSVTTYNCDISGEKTITVKKGTTGTSIPLLDKKAVSLVSCYFTCLQENSQSSPAVEINFVLKQAGSVSNAFFEKTASIPFKASFSLRNAPQ